MMADENQVKSWLEGLAEDDWRMYHSDSEVQNIAKAALDFGYGMRRKATGMETRRKGTMIFVELMIAGMIGLLLGYLIGRYS